MLHCEASGQPVPLGSAEVVFAATREVVRRTQRIVRYEPELGLGWDEAASRLDAGDD